MRREVHDRIYQQLRKERCDKDGNQENNLTKGELKELESLKKRIEKENLIIVRTDKSGKLCVATEDRCKEMGREHVMKDKVVDRNKVIESEKVMNEHSATWCNMWMGDREAPQT